MLSILFNTLLESAPYVVLGFLISGVIHFYIPQNILQKHLGRKAKGALTKSVGIGFLLPLCSCGTIPLGIGLFRSGASVGNILAFMTSTPILSPILIMLSLKMLGIKITLTLLLTAIVGAYLIGAFGNKFFRNTTKRKLNKNKAPNYTPIKKEESQDEDNKIYKTLKWSFFDLGADVSVDIAIGLFVASLILSVLPMEWISSWLGQQDLYTLIYVVLLGIPVYACSIPSIPIVQGLLLLGASPGAAIAYMIAGPATNLGELNAIRKAMSKKTAIFYSLALVVLALLAGTLTDQLMFPDYQYHAFRRQGELIIQQCCVPLIFGDTIGSSPSASSIPVWHWPFGLILITIIGFGIFTKLKSFVVYPCRSCTWKAYGKQNCCGSKCHVKRKYDFFKRIFSKTK